MSSEAQKISTRENKGYFGIYGGQYVGEELLPVLNDLERAYEKYSKDKDFQNEFNEYLKNYAARPTMLYFAERLTKHYGTAKIFLKREDLLHTGAHKINNALGQALLAKRMGKKTLIAETGAGQHGVATATVAALFGMQCKIFMGKIDMQRQALNVFRMKLLGAEVVPVTRGNKVLGDAVDAAIEYFVQNNQDVHYVIGSAVGPHPYPMMVRDFQSVISREIKEQLRFKTGGRVDYILACIGGGSNAIGAFYEFINDKNVKKIGVEAGGKSNKQGEHAMTMNLGRPGVLHGSYSYVLEDENGKLADVYSISAGLDYPGVGPEHAFFKDTNIAEYVYVRDDEAINALQLLSRTEGIIPAVESSHALAYLEKLMPKTKKDEVVVVNLSGRGDKDVAMVAEYLENLKKL